MVRSRSGMTAWEGADGFGFCGQSAPRTVVGVVSQVRGRPVMGLGLMGVRGLSHGGLFRLWSGLCSEFGHGWLVLQGGGFGRMFQLWELCMGLVQLFSWIVGVL